MSQQRTVALNGLYGYGWVDDFMLLPTLIRLPILSSIVVLISITPWLMGAGLQSAMFIFTSMVMMGATLAVLVILARGAQSDFEEGHQSPNGLIPERKDIIKEQTIGVVLGLLTMSYFAETFDGSQSWLSLFSPSFYATQNIGVILQELLVNLTVFVSSILVVNVAFFTFRQTAAFMSWAKRIEIDLLHTEDYQIFTMQALRYLLITVVFLSLNILAYQALIFTESAETIILALLPVVLVMLCGIYFYVQPVIAIKNRIATAKELEVSAVREALSGNRQALQGAQIGHLADEFAAPDLMMYEQYIRTIWEWPIQGYVLRILFYVLLPPLAWVLAALVEQVVDGMV